MINSAAQNKIKQSNFTPEVFKGIFKFIPKIVNPTNTEFEAIFKHKRFNDEPKYITDITKPNGQPGKQIRLDFCGHIKSGNIQKEYTITFVIRNTEMRSSKDDTKSQYIDNYGTAIYDDGTFTNNKFDSFNSSKCRKSFFGEATLIDFLKKLNGVKNAYTKEGDSYVRNPKLSDDQCEIYFTPDEVKCLFSGDITPIKEMLTVPVRDENFIPVMIGTREYTDKEGNIKQTNCVYTNKFVSGNQADKSIITNYQKALQGYCSSKEEYEAVEGYIVSKDSNVPTANTASAIPEINTVSDIEESDDLPF